MKNRAAKRSILDFDPINSKKERLRSIIEKRSFSYGNEITLSSGKKSLLYFDMKPTMMDPEASVLIANQLLKRIPSSADYVGGLEMGAVPIVSALCPIIFENGRNLKTFFIRKKAKEHGVQKTIEGLHVSESLRDQKVVILDDVTTTGGSVLSTLETLSLEGAKVLKIVSVVDRNEGAREAFQKIGLEFEWIYEAGDFLR